MDEDLKISMSGVATGEITPVPKFSDDGSVRLLLDTFKRALKFPDETVETPTPWNPLKEP